MKSLKVISGSGEIFSVTIPENGVIGQLRYAVELMGSGNSDCGSSVITAGLEHFFPGNYRTTLRRISPADAFKLGSALVELFSSSGADPDAAADKRCIELELTMKDPQQIHRETLSVPVCYPQSAAENLDRSCLYLQEISAANPEYSEKSSGIYEIVHSALRNSAETEKFFYTASFTAGAETEIPPDNVPAEFFAVADSGFIQPGLPFQPEKKSFSIGKFFNHPRFSFPGVAELLLPVSAGRMDLPDASAADALFFPDITVLSYRHEETVGDTPYDTLVTEPHLSVHGSFPDGGMPGSGTFLLPEKPGFFIRTLYDSGKNIAFSSADSGFVPQLRLAGRHDPYAETNVDIFESGSGENRITFHETPEFRINMYRDEETALISDTTAATAENFFTSVCLLPAAGNGRTEGKYFHADGKNMERYNCSVADKGSGKNFILPVTAQDSVFFTAAEPDHSEVVSSSGREYSYSAAVHLEDEKLFDPPLPPHLTVTDGNCYEQTKQLPENNFHSSTAAQPADKGTVKITRDIIAAAFAFKWTLEYTASIPDDILQLCMDYAGIRRAVAPAPRIPESTPEQIQAAIERNLEARARFLAGKPKDSGKEA